MKELCFEQLAFHNGSVLNSFMKLKQFIHFILFKKQKVCFAFSKNGTFALEKAKVPDLRQFHLYLIERDFFEKELSRFTTGKFLAKENIISSVH